VTVQTFREVIGHSSDVEFHDLLHELQRGGRVARLHVPTAELGRRRFKAVDQNGVEYGVALARGDVLRDGSVLLLSAERAVVVDAEAPQTLKLRALTVEGGVQLGWHAGHLHWRVRMDEDTMTVLLDAPREEYLARIESWVAAGAIQAVG
jgi:urease accessory protein